METQTTELPNAFLFKVYIDGEYKTCVCPRINNQWSINDVFYIKTGDVNNFNDILDDNLFSVIFVGCYKEGDGYLIKNVNSHYMKSDTAIAREMYQQGTYFETIEKGYQHFYGQEAGWQGIETPTN